MDERRCTVSQPQSVVKVAMPSFSFNPGCRESKALSAQVRDASTLDIRLNRFLHTAL